MRNYSILRPALGAVAVVLVLSSVAEAQRPAPPGARHAIPDFRIRGPGGRWTVETDATGGHITLVEQLVGGERNVIEVRVRPVSGDSAAGTPIDVAQRLRDAERRSLEARARATGWRLEAAVADTVIGCRQLTGVRWRLSPSDARRSPRREDGVVYFYTPPDYRSLGRAVELRWQSAVPVTGEPRPLDPFYLVIESLERTTPASGIVC